MTKNKIAECERLFSKLQKRPDAPIFSNGGYSPKDNRIVLPPAELSYIFFFRAAWHEWAHFEFHHSAEYDKYKAMMREDEFFAFKELVADATCAIVSFHLCTWEECRGYIIRYIRYFKPVFKGVTMLNDIFKIALAIASQMLDTELDPKKDTPLELRQLLLIF